MKRSFTIVALLLLIGIESKAQKEVLFKIKYLPNHTYASALKLDMNMLMDVKGDSTVMNQMKQSGQQFPMNMVMQSGMNINMQTGVTKPSKDFPLTMSVQSTATTMSINGKSNAMPMPQTNQVFYGQYSSEGKLTIDSISGKKIDDATKQMAIKMIDGVQANIKFPEKPMKIGDTFTQETPIDLPIAGFAAKMLSKTTYKLTGIEGNKAFFDMTYTISMDMTNQAMTIDMKGGGDGKIVYDIANNFPSNVVNNMSMDYTMPMPQMANASMSGRMKMVSEYQTTITAK